jgi:hypothetical protein
VSSAGGSFSHTSFHIGSDLIARCSTYPDQVPIHSLDAGNRAVSITPAGQDATGDALKFARTLLHAVQEFAEEIERMHAARSVDEGGSSATGMAAGCGTSAAGSMAA